MVRKSFNSSVDKLLVPVTLIERRIYLIRGLKVMVDSDLAELYQVETFNLNKAVKRNLDRFPEDFMFQLTAQEAKSLVFQIGIPKIRSGRGGSRYAPYAFTEHGIAMLSAILSSPRAVQMSILIVRAFVHIRELVASHKELASRIEKLEAAQKDHTSIISILADEITKMKHVPPGSPKPKIGFVAD